MKRQYPYAALAAAMTVALSTANAQSARTERVEEFSRSLTHEQYLKGADLRASQIVGARVRNAQGETLGEIEELVIPSRDQDDMLVVVSVGGVLDVGDKLVALPYDDLRVSVDGDTFYFDRTEAQLKSAPVFTYDTQAEVQTAVQREPVRDAQRERVETVRTTEDKPGTTTTRTTTAPRVVATTPSAKPTAAKSINVVLDVFDYRASDLIGATVLDDLGKSVGKVDDIVVSTEDDKLHAVLAIGGFAGFGAKRISLPFDDLQLTSDDDEPQVRIAMTGEQLQALVESRPEFHYERQVAQAPGGTPRG
jgi:sporulation protein YlmC with PRC-barrel domain